MALELMERRSGGKVSLRIFYEPREFHERDDQQTTMTTLPLMLPADEHNRTRLTPFVKKLLAKWMAWTR